MENTEDWREVLALVMGGLFGSRGMSIDCGLEPYVVSSETSLSFHLIPLMLILNLSNKSPTRTTSFTGPVQCPARPESRSHHVPLSTISKDAASSDPHSLPLVVSASRSLCSVGLSSVRARQENPLCDSSYLQTPQEYGWDQAELL